MLTELLTIPLPQFPSAGTTLRQHSQLQIETFLTCWRGLWTEWVYTTKEERALTPQSLTKKLFKPLLQSHRSGEHLGSSRTCVTGVSTQMRSSGSMEPALGAQFLDLDVQ